MLKDNLERFERLLNVQSNNLRDELIQQRHEIRHHSEKLDQLFQTYVLILEEGKLIRKATALGLTPNFKDPVRLLIVELGLMTGVAKLAPAVHMGSNSASLAQFSAGKF